MQFEQSTSKRAKQSNISQRYQVWFWVSPFKSTSLITLRNSVILFWYRYNNYITAKTLSRRWYHSAQTNWCLRIECCHAQTQRNKPMWVRNIQPSLNGIVDGNLCFILFIYGKFFCAVAQLFSTLLLLHWITQLSNSIYVYHPPGPASSVRICLLASKSHSFIWLSRLLDAATVYSELNWKLVWQLSLCGIRQQQ